MKSAQYRRVLDAKKRLREIRTEKIALKAVLADLVARCDHTFPAGGSAMREGICEYRCSICGYYDPHDDF